MAGGGPLRIRVNTDRNRSWNYAVAPYMDYFEEPWIGERLFGDNRRKTSRRAWCEISAAACIGLKALILPRRPRIHVSARGFSVWV